MWRGQLYDGVTPARHTVTVTVTAMALRIETDAGALHWWPYAELRQSPAHSASEPVRLERGDAAVVIEDDAFLTALRAVGFGADHLRDAGARRRRLALLLAGSLAAAAIGAALWLWGVPRLAARVAARVPVAWEENLGRSVTSQFLAVSGRCEVPAVQAAVDSIVERLAAALPGSGYRFQVTVTTSPVLNAFAAPGGFMVVNQGLLRHTKSPDELAGVMAHEMSHVTLRHGTQAVLRELPARVLLGTLTGDLAAVGQAAQAAGTLALLRYRRDDEVAADRDGMALLLRAGADSDGMIAFFETMQREAGDVPSGLTYLSTHPSTAARIGRLRDQAAAAPGTPVALPGAARWRTIAAGCDAAR